MRKAQRAEVAAVPDPRPHRKDLARRRLLHGLTAQSPRAIPSARGGPAEGSGRDLLRCRPPRAAARKLASPSSGETACPQPTAQATRPLCGGDRMRPEAIQPREPQHAWREIGAAPAACAGTVLPPQCLQPARLKNLSARPGSAPLWAGEPAPSRGTVSHIGEVAPGGRIESLPERLDGKNFKLRCTNSG